MRSVKPVIVVVVMLVATVPSAAADRATASVTVTATFATRTALEVSTQLLQFNAVERGQPAMAAVEFAARARTGATSEVVLSVEPLRTVDGPDGTVDVEAAVTFDGIGEGTLRGRMAAARPAVAGRWMGSGRRKGRLVFALRAGAAGRYTLPVRFVLSAP